MGRQYPFDLAPEPDFTFDKFQVGRSNRDAYKAIRSYPDWPSPILLLTGPKGCGKSHLGEAWAKVNTNIVFVDDAETKDEFELFNTVNQALNGDISAILLASEILPEAWNVKLPDLYSRLKNCPIVYLEEPDDDILEPITRKLFNDNGRDIGADTVEYILKNCERTVPAISRLIKSLEIEARADKKDITRTFVSRYLKRAGDL